MIETPPGGAHDSAPIGPSKALRRWLTVLSLVAVTVACAAVMMGWLVMMDTQIEMNPHGDALIRQDAFGFRVFAWGGIALLLLLLAAGTVGGWIANRRRRYRLSLGLSLLAAAPILLLIFGVISLYVVKSP